MTAEKHDLTLLRHAEPLSVVRLGPGAEVPPWATTSTLFSVTATATETSLVCGAARVPRKARSEGPYLAFSVAGTLDHSLTGVLSGLLAPLAEAAVPVFTVSTFDTDWVLVPANRADDAERTWQEAGYAVRPVEQSDRPQEEQQ